MSFIDNLKNNNAKIRLNEEKIYAEVMREMKSNILRDGLWAKAMSDVNFDEKKAKAKYVKLRVQSIIDEITIHNENLNKKLEQEIIEANKRKIKNVKKQFSTLLSTLVVSVFKFFLWIVLSLILFMILGGILSILGKEETSYFGLSFILSFVVSSYFVFFRLNKSSSKNTKIVKR